MADKEINIAKVINLNLIDLHLNGKTKKDVIKELSTLLKEDDDITNTQDFIDDVFLREEEGETGIGQGVAIPHGKSKAVKNTMIAIGLSDHPIPWETLDDKPVTAVILFAVRDQDADTLHLSFYKEWQFYCLMMISLISYMPPKIRKMLLIFCVETKGDD